MSEERFDRIDRKLSEGDQRFDRVDQRLDGLDRRMDGLDRRMDRLETGQNDLRNDLNGGLEDLGRQMRVLHEDAIARIAATPEYTGPTKAEFAELRDMIGRRLDPLEAAVRDHSVRIGRLERDRS